MAQFQLWDLPVNSYCQKIFNLDAKAYLQIPVKEESSKLLCISTHRGLYKFERLPFGVKVTLAIFQQVMDTMLSSLDFSVAYLDDNLMNSKSVIGHKDHVHKVFA